MSCPNYPRDCHPELCGNRGASDCPEGHKERKPRIHRCGNCGRILLTREEKETRTCSVCKAEKIREKKGKP